MSRIDRDKAGFLLFVGLVACSPAKPTINSAEFGCDGTKPVLQTTITRADKNTTEGDLALTIADPEDVLTIRDVPLTIGTVRINVEKLDGNPDSQAFQPEKNYRVRLAALRGVSREVTRTFDYKIAHYRKDLCQR